MIRRAVILAACLLATSAFLRHAEKAEPTPIRRPLSELSLDVGEWTGRAEPAFSKDVLDQLRVDDYVTRTYVSPREGIVGLYIGYYGTQRQGASIHSPLNCLPGAGWIPIDRGRLALTVDEDVNGPRRPIEINRILIEKGLDRQLVLYWYQSHDRVIASEYAGKVYSVVDAIRLNRTDAALVRVTAPVPTRNADGVEAAERAATQFVSSLFPRLSRFLPT